jgi:hypothetical protein
MAVNLKEYPENDGPEMAALASQIRLMIAQYEELAAERDHLAADRDHLATEIDKTQQRAKRVADLSARLLQQQATPEEVQELQRLIQAGP